MVSIVLAVCSWRSECCFLELLQQPHSFEMSGARLSNRTTELGFKGWGWISPKQECVTLGACDDVPTSLVPLLCGFVTSHSKAAGSSCLSLSLLGAAGGDLSPMGCSEVVPALSCASASQVKCLCVNLYKI